MEDLGHLREKIDSIDDKIIELFEKRMEIVLKVGEYKKQNNIPILNKNREQKVIEKNLKKVKNKVFRKSSEEFLKDIMSISKRLQAKELFSYKEDYSSDHSFNLDYIMCNEAKYLYGLLGEKLGHSFSPNIHSLIFKELNLEGYYHLFEIEKDLLKNAIDAFKVLKIRGVNVTIPYKVDVMKYLDDISDEAKCIGAVNTICFDKGKAVGYNTDYYGFGMMLNKFNIDVKNKKVAILGTGGAAKAVLQYFIDNSVGYISFVSRNKRYINEKFKKFPVILYEELNTLKNYDIIVNCTPCGMYPNVGVSPIKKEDFLNFKVAIDLIYNPQETLFLKYAKECGIKCVNGLYMLIGQAIKAEELWNCGKIQDEIVDKIYKQVSNLI